MISFQCTGGQFGVSIVIVISQDGPNAFRRLQLRQFFRARFNITTIRSCVVACEDEKVWGRLLRQIDYPPNFADSKDLAVMNVCELGNPKALEPSRQIAYEDIRL